MILKPEVISIHWLKSLGSKILYLKQSDILKTLIKKSTPIRYNF